MKRIGVVVVLLVVALIGAVLVRTTVIKEPNELVIVQWSNSHPMREGLLPDMASQFNGGDHQTHAGHRIKVVVVSCDSAVQADDLVSRVSGAGPAPQSCKDSGGGQAADPTIVTPQSSDWLVDVNSRAGRTVVDLSTTKNIAETWLGIVTHRDMAECLGWPAKDFGYADLIAFLSDPQGWTKFSCAQTEWGRQPLLAFTNPNTSTSGRNVLVSLYAIAAGKTDRLDQLTVDDIERPDVVAFVKSFQQLVDHYMPGTIPLNTKVAQGPRYGQFFLMPEDNLVSLYNGTEKVIATDGTVQKVDAVKDLVMIYPKEGSVLNSNPGGIVTAPWVSAEQTEAAAAWIDFLRGDEQQRKFGASGFRPATGTSISVDAHQLAAWGLDGTQPRTHIEPGDVPAPVLDKIMASWGTVKNPAIVTFLVDVSGSMSDGHRLDNAKTGLTRVIDAMSRSEGAANQVGLVTFSSGIKTAIPPSPLQQSKFDIADAVDQMVAQGGTALYDGVQRAIQLTDAAPGDDQATRAVVVLSDGAANEGGCLDAIVSMRSTDERPISQFCGLNGIGATDDRGENVAPKDVNGESLSFVHVHPVQVFFVGFGDADIDIGRILAQATGAEYQGSTEKDLAKVIEELSGYF